VIYEPLLNLTETTSLTCRKEIPVICTLKPVQKCLLQSFGRPVSIRPLFPLMQIPDWQQPSVRVRAKWANLLPYPK